MRRYREEHQWRRRLPGLFLDAEARKLGEQTGLDTPVVLAVNTEHWRKEVSAFFLVAKALSVPPGEYGRKAETQRN